MRRTGKKRVAGCAGSDETGRVFNLDPADRRSLTDQLVDNVSRAVALGVYKPGDRLPGLRKMAALCGTSLRVPVDAVAKLTEMGIVRGRPRSGIEILAKGRKVYRGHVVLIQEGEYVTYYREALFHSLAIELTKLGWFSEYVTIPRKGRNAERDYRHLEDALARKPSLVFSLYSSDDLVSVIARSGAPFAVLTSMNRTVEGSIGTVSFCTSRALSDFALACRAKKLRSMLLVASPEDDFRFVDIFSRNGVKTERLNVAGVTHGAGMLDEYRRAAGRLLAERLSDASLPRPDIVYFADDHFTESGLWTISLLGLRIPEDIRVVTFANRGNMPVYGKSLACVVEDLSADARVLAHAMARYMKTGTFKTILLSSAQFVSGETF